MSRRIPKYSVHNVRDIAYIFFNGKRHYFPGSANSVESVNAYNEFLKTYVLTSSKLPTDLSSLTITDLVRAYHEYASNHFEDKGHQSTYALMMLVALKLEADYGHVKVADFGPKALKEFRRGLIEDGNSRSYVNSQIGKIRRIFKWGASEELVPITIYQGLTTVDAIKRGREGAKDPPKRKPAAWDDVETIAKVLHQPVQTMVYFQWHTGVRSQSIVNAHADQFERDFDGMLIWLPKHKTEHLERVVKIPLGPKAEELIKERLAKGGYLFPTKFGTIYKTWTYRRAIVRAQEELYAKELDKHEEEPHKYPAPRRIRWTPHQLRHAKGKYIREKYGIEAAQALLGHDSLQATQIYSEKRFELAKQIASQEG